MYELNLKVNEERLKDFRRDAENERLAQDVQKQEKNSPLRNVFKSLNPFAGNESKER